MTHLKPNRRAGGFFVVWRGELPIYYVDEQYHLYKDNAHLFSQRDAIELDDMRQKHIAKSDRIEIEDALYIVCFNCDISDETKNAIISRYHQGNTHTLEWHD